MDSEVKPIKIEVAYALPDKQELSTVNMSPNSTVQQAIAQSGVLERYREIDLAVNKVGIFGKLTKLSQSLRDGDRVEIYRPLIADPKEVRRQRAAQGKAMKRGAGDVTEGETGS